MARTINDIMLATSNSKHSRGGHSIELHMYMYTLRLWNSLSCLLLRRQGAKNWLQVLQRMRMCLRGSNQGPSTIKFGSLPVVDDPFEAIVVLLSSCQRGYQRPWTLEFDKARPSPKTALLEPFLNHMRARA
jgi:hypothetical protein